MHTAAPTVGIGKRSQVLRLESPELNWNRAHEALMVIPPLRTLPRVLVLVTWVAVALTAHRTWRTRDAPSFLVCYMSTGLTGSLALTWIACCSLQLCLLPHKLQEKFRLGRTHSPYLFQDKKSQPVWFFYLSWGWLHYPVITLSAVLFARSGGGSSLLSETLMIHPQHRASLMELRCSNFSRPVAEFSTLRRVWTHSWSGACADLSGVSAVAGWGLGGLVSRNDIL